MESPITSGSVDQISKKKDTGSGVMEHLLATQPGMTMRDPMDLGRTVLQWRMQCTSILRGKWHDLGCFDSHPFVCEIDLNLLRNM